MKEDSLLSNLSNLSYHGNNHSVDFFNDSSLLGQYPEIKVKQQVEQEQVNLNQLSAFAHHQPLSPKRNGHLLAAYWTDHNHLLQGNSDIGQSHVAADQQQLQIQPEPKPKIEPLIPFVLVQPVKLEQPYVKIQPQPIRMLPSSQSDVDEQIGTVIKNETKNIPKNYGKAIITYIEKQRENFQPVLRANGVQYQELLSQLSKKKKYINTIANLRDLWVDFKYSKCMRILSNQFLRKYALQYIFNSRICNYTSHVKYRKRLQEAIQAPTTFRHIKQY